MRELLFSLGSLAILQKEHWLHFHVEDQTLLGAILAAGIQADLYENFTDVDSVYAANPNIVKDPVEIKRMTYQRNA